MGLGRPFKTMHSRVRVRVRDGCSRLSRTTSVFVTHHCTALLSYLRHLSTAAPTPHIVAHCTATHFLPLSVVEYAMSADEPLYQSPDTSSTDNLPDPDLKIILLGDSAVGKSKSEKSH